MTRVSLAAGTWIGGIFQFGVDGWIEGLRYYAETDGAEKVGQVWLLNDPTAFARAFDERAVTAADGFKNVWLHPRMRITAGLSYMVAIQQWVRYYRNVNAFAGGAVTHGQITYVSGFQTTGVIPQIVTITSNNNANAVDVLFNTR